MKTFAFLVAVSAMAASGSLALQSGKAAAKPPSQGAVQMPGESGKLGTPYQLGKKGEELVFTLEKVEFASRALMKDAALWPKEGERLVVLHYAIQNPGTGDRFFFGQSFAFTVVSPDDENYLCDGAAANGLTAYHPDRRERLSMQLKPTQKVRAITVVQIHPKGPVNKLIVQRGKGTPVLRYTSRDVWCDPSKLLINGADAEAKVVRLLPCTCGPEPPAINASMTRRCPSRELESISSLSCGYRLLRDD